MTTIKQTLEANADHKANLEISVPVEIPVGQTTVLITFPTAESQKDLQDKNEQKRQQEILEKSQTAKTIWQFG